MLIDAVIIQAELLKHNINIRGVLHVGAHMCEEMDVYVKTWNINPSNIIWVDANPDLVKLNKTRGISNCYNAVLDETEHNASFNITNNGQSSSLLEFGSHSKSYPNIVVTKTINVKTQTLEQFFTNNNLDSKKYNFWNFDIQGSEFAVFRGSPHMLKDVDAIYTEINTSEVYKGCGLLQDIDKLLDEYGLKRVITRMTRENWGDALYVRVNTPKKYTSSYGSMTIAIPTYRRFHSFLRDTIPKYLNLPFVDKIIIGDETGEDIDAIQKEPWGSNSKLEFIRNEERLGAYHNKLNVMRHCNTDWIALIDSDNELCPEYFLFLEQYWDTYGANSKEIYIPADVTTRNNQKTYTPIKHFANRKINRTNWNEVLRESWAEYLLNLGNCVFHKTSVRNIPDTIEKDVMVDCKVVNKLLVEKNYTLVVVPGMKYYHNVHAESLYLKTKSQQIEFQKNTNWEIT